jgi:hypothetical protein
VVDEDIEPSKSICDRTGERLAMVRGGNATHKGDYGGLFSEVVETVFSPGCHNNLSASLPKSPSESLAKTRRGSSD